MELYEILPECRHFIEPLADIKLVTRGHYTVEDSFHPLLWFSTDGYTAHYYMHPNAESAERFQQLLSNREEVNLLYVRFEDAMLDSWESQYSLSVENCTLWDCVSLRRDYDVLFAETKNILKYDEGTLLKAYDRIMASVEEACMKFYHLCRFTQS
jgi:hypothetical protein